MRMPWHKPHVKLSAQIYNGWSIQIEAPAAQAMVFMAGIVNMVKPSTPVMEPANVVGFHGATEKAPTPRRPVVRADDRG